MRLFGLSVSEEEDGGSDAAKSLTKRVYDTIIKPVLAAAKFNKHLKDPPLPPQCNLGGLPGQGQRQAQADCRHGHRAAPSLAHHHQVRHTGGEDGLPP